MACAAALAVVVLAGGTGCAHRPRASAPSTTEVTKAPPAEQKDESGRVPSRVPAETALHLPGQSRYLPSEDPRNQPPPGAPPMPVVVEKASSGAKASAVAPTAPSGSAVAPAVVEDASASDVERKPPASATRRTPVSATPEAAPGDPSAPLRPPPVPPGEIRYRVQVFASSTSYAAFRRRDEVAAGTGEAVYIEKEGAIWKVRLGDLQTREEANALRRRLIGLGYSDAFIVEVAG